MWNKFESSSTEEETLGHSFLTNGLFKISNDELSVKDPQIKAAFQNKNIVIAVDKSLIFIENEAECSFFSFDVPIECFAMSRSGDFTVCCLKDGNIHGVHCKGVPLFNLMINKEDVGESKTFLNIIQVEDNYKIMCSNGRVYKLHEINEKQLVRNTEAGDDSTETILKSVKLDKVSNIRLSKSIHAFCCVETFDGEQYIVVGAEGVYFITADNVDRISYPANIGRMREIFNLENFIVGLTDAGALVEICPHTKVMRTIGSPNIVDMRVLESNDEYIELLVLSAAEQGERSMKVLDFPSLTCKNELKVPEISWLVTQQKSSVNMYFISGLKNPSDFVQTIELKSITETDPEQRFKKLLLRGHFDEAEEFAKQFDLSLEPLHEARVKRSILKLQSLNPSSERFDQTFKELMMQMSLVEDKNFLVTLRTIGIPNRTSLTTFVEYLLAHIDTNQHPEATNEINELLLRLETLRLIDPDECNMQWQKFLYHSDMARAAMDHFKSDVLLSCLIWSRHSSSIMPKLNLEQFHKWLANIPTTIEPFNLVQWLKHFSPCFLQLYPNEMTHLVTWCLGRTRALQFSNKWPEVGLEFIVNINEIFKDVKFMMVDIHRAYHNNMDKIHQLIFTLEELTVLQKSYHLTMILDDYSKSSIDETAYKLLQRVQMHNLTRLVNDFLYPIYMERGLDPEETIVKYIQFLCSNKNIGQWQERAVISIDLLHNEDLRLDSALLVLKVSPVPWSEVVMPLAALGSASNHPSAQAIFIEFKTQSVKTIKVKYGWPADYFDLQADREKLVFRVLKLNLPNMIEDVKTLVKASPEITHNAYTYLMHRLVELAMIEELVELVADIQKDLEEESSLDLLLKVTNGFARLIDENDAKDEEHEANIMETIGLLVNRMVDSLESWNADFQKKRLKDLKNIIQVRRVFQLDVSQKNLSSEVERKRMLEEGVAMTVAEARRSSSIDGVWSKMDLLVSTFGFNRIHVLTMICKKLGNLFITCRIVDMLCDTIDNVEKCEVESSMELAVLMIAQQMAYFENNLSATFDHYDPLTFPLAYKLLVKCFVHQDLFFHQHIMELISWMFTGRQFYPHGVIESTRSERVIDSKIFGSQITNGSHKQNGDRRESFSVFDAVEEKVVMKQQHVDENLIPILRFVCNGLKVVSLAIKADRDPFKRFRKFFTNYDVQEIKNEFFVSFEAVLKLKQNQAAWKVMQQIIEQQDIASTVVIPAQFVANVHKKMLKFLLSQKEPSYMFAFSILKSDGNKDECIEYLRNNLKNNSQKIAFSTFTEMYNKYLGNMGKVADSRQNRLKFYYYSELCKYDASLRFKSNLDIDELLKDLENRQLSVELVKKLAKDFGWDYQKSLVQQVKILLRTQQLEFDIETDVFGNDQVVVKSSVEMIRKKCAPYLSEITNLPLLATEMLAFMKEVNFYFYEMYLMVLELIQHCNGEISTENKIFRHILLLLQHKLTSKRRGTDQHEHDLWQKLQAENGILPAIAKYRLPFKPMMQGLPETFLNEDLNVDTFEKLIPLITLHAPNINSSAEDRIEICAFLAVKNSVMDLKAKVEAQKTVEWSLKPTNNGFLKTALRMVSLIKDKSKSIAILYYIVNHSPEGSDQVEAAFECWKFALAHEHEVQMSKYVDIVARIKRKYPLLKSQHLLHLYGMNDDKLMQLVESPADLISGLYHHESILLPQKKDINKLCNELAKIHEIDLLTLQHKLLHKWLAFAGNTSYEEGDVNETLYEDFVGSPDINDVECVSEENVVRAHYILSSWNNREAMDFLASEIGTNSVNTDNQLQLYETFAKLIDDHSESYKELINPNHFILIKCCHYLKQLGLILKPETFKEMDKVALLKKVWTSHFNNSKGLEVMSFICLGFNVHIPQIWNGILKQMVALKMTQHLSILVEVLSTQSKLLHLASLKTAWECVIKEPFLHASKARTYEQDANIAKALILLQKCPISTFLNLGEFIEHCLRLERPHMAAVFVAFANEKNREKFVKLLEPFDKKQLKNDIEELEELGVAPVITKSAVNILKL